MMCPDAGVEKIYLYPKPVDFRKSIDELTCACGCAKHVIGEEASEQLDIVPMQNTASDPGTLDYPVRRTLTTAAEFDA